MQITKEGFRFVTFRNESKEISVYDGKFEKFTVLLSLYCTYQVFIYRPLKLGSRVEKFSYTGNCRGVDIQRRFNAKRIEHAFFMAARTCS